MKRHMKDVWQEFFDEAVEVGLSNDEAEITANVKTYDYYASIADDIADRKRDACNDARIVRAKP